MSRWTLRTLYWLILNIVAIWMAVLLVPGISIIRPQEVVYVGVVLALVNGWIGPFLRLVTWPLRLLTFGLFSFIVNWLLFVVAAWLSRQVGVNITITGLLPALEGALVVAIILALGNRINPFAHKKHIF